MRLAPGAETATCPKCGTRMSTAKRGRGATTTHLWFRTCLDLGRCGLTTYTDERPAYIVDTVAPAIALPGSLPFDQEGSR